MRARELERILAGLTHFEPSQLGERTRALRAAGLLAVAGRGTNAHALTVEEAARILVSLGAPCISDAAEFVGTLCRQRLSEGSTPFESARSFGAALALILTDPECRLEVEAVLIHQVRPFAILRRSDGREHFFGHVDPERARRAGHPTGAVAIWVTLPVSLLSQVALELGASPKPLARASDLSCASAVPELLEDETDEGATGGGWADSADGAEAEAAFQRARDRRTTPPDAA